MVMVAFGINAPDSSVTFPEMIPVGAWAYTVMTATKNANISLDVNFDMTPSLLVRVRRRSEQKLAYCAGSAVICQDVKPTDRSVGTVGEPACNSGARTRALQTFGR